MNLRELSRVTDSLSVKDNIGLANAVFDYVKSKGEQVAVDVFGAAGFDYDPSKSLSVYLSAYNGSDQQRASLFAVDLMNKGFHEIHDIDPIRVDSIIDIDNAVPARYSVDPELVEFYLSDDKALNNFEVEIISYPEDLVGWYELFDDEADYSSSIVRVDNPNAIEEYQDLIDKGDTAIIPDVLENDTIPTVASLNRGKEWWLQAVYMDSAFKRYPDYLVGGISSELKGIALDKVDFFGIFTI